jgi:hypothetical protein
MVEPSGLFDLKVSKFDFDKKKDAKVDQFYKSNEIIIE